MKTKRGKATDSAIITIYRIFLVLLVAIIFSVLSSMFYSYEISVRDSEAMIFGRQMVDCIAPNGILNLDSLNVKDRGDIFSFCGFDKSETKRFFLSVAVDENGKEIDKLVGGDEGLSWVRKVYTSGFKTTSIEQYKPGYYRGVFSVEILKGNVEKNGKINLEVIVKDES